MGTRDEVAHDSNDGGGDLGNSIIIISILIRELRGEEVQEVESDSTGDSIALFYSNSSQVTQRLKSQTEKLWLEK